MRDNVDTKSDISKSSPAYMGAATAFHSSACTGRIKSKSD